MFQPTALIIDDSHNYGLNHFVPLLLLTELCIYSILSGQLSTALLKSVPHFALANRDSQCKPRLLQFHISQPVFPSLGYLIFFHVLQAKLVGRKGERFDLEDTGDLRPKPPLENLRMQYSFWDCLIGHLMNKEAAFVGYWKCRTVLCV